jgi:hypothetical protein
MKIEPSVESITILSDNSDMSPPQEAMHSCSMNFLDLRLIVKIQCE